MTIKHLPSFRFQAVCNIPRPEVNGYPPRGEIHPDVIPAPDGASRFLMVWTPFPGGPHATETEYPCIARSDDGINWSLPEGAPVPLVNNWSGTFNADPDLLFVKDRYYLYYQTYHNKLWSVFSIQSPGFHFEGAGVRAIRPDRFSRSPSVLYDRQRDSFLMYFDEKDKTTGYFTVKCAESKDGVTFPADTIKTCLELPAETAVWHPAVRYYNGYFWMMAPLYHGPKLKGGPWLGDLYLWTSLNGWDWTPGSKIISYLNLPGESGKFPISAYRAAMLFQDDTCYLWLSYYLAKSTPTFSWAHDFECRIALYTSPVERPWREDCAGGGKVIIQRRFSQVTAGRFYRREFAGVHFLRGMERDDGWDAIVPLQFEMEPEPRIFFYSRNSKATVLYRVNRRGEMDVLWESREGAESDWRRITAVAFQGGPGLLFQGNNGVFRLVRVDDHGMDRVWEIRSDGEWQPLSVHYGNWVLLYNAALGRGRLCYLNDGGMDLLWEADGWPQDCQISAGLDIIPYLLFHHPDAGEIGCYSITKDGLELRWKRKRLLWRGNWSIVSLETGSAFNRQLLFYEAPTGRARLFEMKNDKLKACGRMTGLPGNCRAVLPLAADGPGQMIFLYGL
jgi:hypothetical protein